MNKELAAQFLSAIITRNSGQRIEDDVKEALAYTETFERLTADYTTPQAVQELIQNPPFEQYVDFTRYGFAEGKLESPVIQALRRINELEERITFIHNALQQSAKDGYIIKNPPFEQEKWTLKFNGTDGKFYTKHYRNDTLVCLLDSYAKCGKITFLVTANNGILSTWDVISGIVGFFGEEKDIHVIPCFSEKEVKQQIDAYYEERGGFAKHVEYLKSIGQW